MTALFETTDAASSNSTTYTMAVGDTFEGTLDPTGDRDWVEITLAAGQTINIDLFGSGGSALSDPYLRLYDSSGALVAENDDAVGLNSSLIYTNADASPATFYISAGSYADLYSGTYTIDVDEVIVEPDLIAGDTSTTARLLLGESQSSAIETTGDRDWFAFTYDANATYWIDVDSNGGLFDPSLVIYDSLGNQVWFSFIDNWTSGEDLFDPTLASGEYFIEVASFNDVGTGEYTVSVREMPTNPAPPSEAGASQWYLGAIGDLAVIWDDYSGVGVSVGIFDDGVEYDHPDLDLNYDASRHVVVGGATLDPYPVASGDAHGTAVAGIIGSENNGIGSTGIAHGAWITGVNIFAGAADINANTAGFLDAVDDSENFDVINHSWGSTAQFGTFAGRQDTIDEWLEALEFGRGGLGTVQVKSAGNSNTNANGEDRDATRATITVGAYDDTGDTAYYSDFGANLLISAPSSGGLQGQFTTDRAGANGYDSTDYTFDFGGTSGAAPIVTGTIAVMMEANGNLGWRDIQTILAYSAMEIGSGVGGNQTPNEDHEWFLNAATNWNGGGLHFSEDYGFGSVNVYNAVRMAEVWSLFDVAQVTSNENSVTVSNGTDRTVVDNGMIEQVIAFGSGSMDVEYVDVTIEMIYNDWDDILIELVSEAGTVVELFNGAFFDAPYLGTTLSWTFGVNALRGETASGDWIVRVTDTDDNGSAGTLLNTEITWYGQTGAQVVDDVYHFTDEFDRFFDGGTISDTDGGVDWVNAAAVSAGSIIDLGTGQLSQIGGQNHILAGFENVVTGDSRDIVTGNFAANEIHGMRGNDLLRGAGGDDEIHGGVGNDVIYGARGSDTVFAGDGTDYVSGSFDADFLHGENGRDRLFGEGGDDSLFGGEDGDRLFGGDGEDTLDGGEGNDIMEGGADDDIFVFAEENGFDTIRDFTDGDRFDFSYFGLTDTGTSDQDWQDAASRVREANGSVFIFWSDEGFLRLESTSLSDLTDADFIF